MLSTINVYINTKPVIIKNGGYKSCINTHTEWNQMEPIGSKS
jgi:hypothetical protein